MNVYTGLFETFVTEQGYSVAKDSAGNYQSPITQIMWQTWCHYEALQYSHLETIGVLNARISRLLKENHELDARRAAAMNMAAGLAEEVSRLTSSGNPYASPSTIGSPAPAAQVHHSSSACQSGSAYFSEVNSAAEECGASSLTGDSSACSE